MLSELASEIKTLFVIAQIGEGFLICKFLTSRLNREVSLPESDNGFIGIAVLNDQITGVA